MPRKPANQQFDTIQAIRDQAFVLFGRFGYEGVSIGEIARHSKLSKGALYWHFPGKEALYLDCLQRLHAIFNEYIFDPMRATNDPVRSILHLFRALNDLLQDPRVQSGIAGYWLIPSRPETGRIVESQQAFEAASREVIAETLRNGVAQGHFDFGNDLEDMAGAIISLVEAVVLPLRHQGPDEVKASLGVLARTLFRAYAKDDALIGMTREF
jgi:TetR/AcrR family acrAB operon transcriptional repressor